MEPRSGHSHDYDEDKRQLIYDTYMEMIDDYSLTEIANRVGLSLATLYGCRHSKWWARMEEDYQR